MKPALSLIVFFVYILVSAALIGSLLHAAMERDKRFGSQQTQEQVVARYQSCKAAAPKGMDCVMIPMLVSDEFMKGQWVTDNAYIEYKEAGGTGK